MLGSNCAEGNLPPRVIYFRGGGGGRNFPPWVIYRGGLFPVTQTGVYPDSGLLMK